MFRAASTAKATEAPGTAAQARASGAGIGQAADSQLAAGRAGACLSVQPGVTLVPIAAFRTRLALAIKSGRLPAITHSRTWTIKHNGSRYAVFDTGGQLEVTDARCPHNGGPLEDGLVRDGAVSCPWHRYCFDLRTGECRTAAGYQLRKYPVLSRDGRLFAELPGVARPRGWLRLWQLLPAGRRS